MPVRGKVKRQETYCIESWINVIYYFNGYGVLCQTKVCFILMEILKDKVQYDRLSL